MQSQLYKIRITRTAGETRRRARHHRSLSPARPHSLPDRVHARHRETSKHPGLSANPRLCRFSRITKTRRLRRPPRPRRRPLRIAPHLHPPTAFLRPCAIVCTLPLTRRSGMQRRATPSTSIHDSASQAAILANPNTAADPYSSAYRGNYTHRYIQLLADERPKTTTTKSVPLSSRPDNPS